MRSLALAAVALCVLPSTVSAQTIWGKVTIETRILDFDPFAGMKSRHTISIVEGPGGSYALQQAFETGTTDFFGISLPSVRDNFTASNLRAVVSTSISDPTLIYFTFDAKGTTASGTLVTPDIDYNFKFIVNVANFFVQGAQNTWTVSGCHDSYPAYKINVSGPDIASLPAPIPVRSANLYSFEHKSKNLLSLFGTCDQNVPSRRVSLQ